MSGTQSVGLLTSAVVAAEPDPIRNLKIPEFAPVPQGKGTEFYSGLRRGAILQLILPCLANDHRPPVKSLSMRRPGTARGTRLIVLEGVFGKQMGLLTYLRAKLREGDTDQAEPALATAQK